MQAATDLPLKDSAPGPAHVGSRVASDAATSQSSSAYEKGDSNTDDKRDCQPHEPELHSPDRAACATQTRTTSNTDCFDSRARKTCRWSATASDRSLVHCRDLQ